MVVKKTAKKATKRAVKKKTTKKSKSNEREVTVESVKQILLHRINRALALYDSPSLETKWKASGILQGLCNAYASLERLK